MYSQTTTENKCAAIFAGKADLNNQAHNAPNFCQTINILLDKGKTVLLTSFCTVVLK